MALSQEQINQKNASQGVTAVLAKSSELNIREAASSYDLDRVTELWANLTMIQQMRGNDHWLERSKNSGLNWNEYISKLFDSKGSKALVFENEELIFGFAYMNLENINASKPALRQSLKAVIKEIYLEPSYRKNVDFDAMAELLRQALKKLGINYFEIDVKDLML